MFFPYSPRTLTGAACAPEDGFQVVLDRFKPLVGKVPAGQPELFPASPELEDHRTQAVLGAGAREFEDVLAHEEQRKDIGGVGIAGLF